MANNRRDRLLKLVTGKDENTYNDEIEAAICELAEMLCEIEEKLGGNVDG